MEKIGDIEIRVVGKVGNQELNPGNNDIRQVAAILQNVEDLLYPTGKKDRPLIAFDQQEGSVRHIFKTSIQAVIGFSALLSQVQARNSVDFLELKTARALENIQKMAREKNYEFQIKTSLREDSELIINPQTHFIRTENVWVEAEFYLYGILKDAGGKSKANIHLDTAEYGYLSIETGQEFLKEREENLLYKTFGVRAAGKQNIDTGEMDTRSLKLLELIDYETKFDKDYLNSKITKARGVWKGIDADAWLYELRGGYEA